MSERCRIVHHAAGHAAGRVARRTLPRVAAPAAILAFAVLCAGDPALAQDPCAGVAPVSPFTLSVFPVVTGLSGRPLEVLSPPGDTDRLFVVEQDGFIRIHHRGDPPGTT